MAQSAEYPDLKWMPPRSWTDANRSSVQMIVIHTTEGSAHAQSAEDGAAYDQRRADGTSAHYFVDNTSVVQCVRTADQAHTARSQGNRRGIHYELCGRAGTQNWADTYSQAMIRLAAKQAARDAKRWGIPVRHLTVAEVASGAKGFCGHHDITRAFPADGGTHTDPGPNFPWSQFLDLVRAELEDDMPTADEIATATAKKVWEYRMASGYASAPAVQAQTTAKAATLAEVQTRGLTASIALLRAEVAGLAGRDFTDEGAIVAGVLAGLDPQAIAAAIPRELVQQVVDELAARLAS